MQSNDTTQGRRVEMILRQVDSLPTLPAVATRLLSLIASDHAHPRQIVEVVQCDPALTAKILSMCCRSDKGARGQVMTMDRAVSLLGFDAVRNASLSVKVVEIFDGADASGEMDRDLHVFDRPAFWKHSLAVAIAAQMIARAHPQHSDLPPEEAFICGLLHDIGKIALDDVLPKSFARAVELADQNQGNIAEYERRVVGLDHHTVGKRLAEQWRLPHRLQDCIWLHGSPYDTLPRLEHRRLIGLITLADTLVRKERIGYSGNYQLKYSVEELSRQIDLDPAAVQDIVGKLHEDLESRSTLMGLDEKPSREMFLGSIQQANQMLGELSSTYQQRSIVVTKQAQMLDAIAAFHASASPGRSVQDVMNEVARSAWNVLGGGFYAIVFQQQSVTPDDRGWLVCQYGEQAHPIHSELLEAPPHGPDLRELDPREPAAMSLMSMVPWVADYLLDAPDLRQVKLLPLSCGWGMAAVLLHDRDQMPPWQQLAALANTWGSAIASASQHDGARRLGEDLAESNFALAEAQDRLLRNESMARVGEMAAGAAHEMNNPLAVISGRSQLLSMTLPKDSKQHKAAQTIVEQSHRLSDLITSLKLFAEPPAPKVEQVNVRELLEDAIDRVRDLLSAEQLIEHVDLSIPEDMPAVLLDPEQVGCALDEILKNAYQAQPKTSITVSARCDEDYPSLVIQVIDDGCGMDEYTLAHAADPFFSAQQAGRRVGMGLARAGQLIAAHNGGIELRSNLGEGTTVTLAMRLDTSCLLTDGENRVGTNQKKRPQMRPSFDSTGEMCAEQNSR